MSCWNRIHELKIIDPVDVTVGDVVGTVVPLRTHLAKGGLLVSFLDVAEMHLRDVDDRDLLRSFTDYAALTLDRGQAMTEREALAVVSDRERIARDLHDLVIQRLFATGMQLQAAAMRVADDEVRASVEGSVADLDATIRDVRATIFELQMPPAESVRSEVQSTRPRVLPGPRLRTGAPDEGARSTLPSPRRCVSRSSRCCVRRSRTSPVTPAPRGWRSSRRSSWLTSA